MTEDPIRVQAKALGDPTRHRIFRYIAEAEHAVDVGELTDHLRLNHNAIRQHLSQLVDAGLVARRIASPRGRGRPRQLFEVHSSSDERWGVAGRYQRLSLWLIEMLRSGDSAIEVGRRAGQETAARRNLGGDQAVLVSTHSREIYEECRAILEGRDFRVFDSREIAERRAHPTRPWSSDHDVLAIGPGRPFDEATLFRLGAAYEATADWHTRNPMP